MCSSCLMPSPVTVSPRGRVSTVPNLLYLHRGNKVCRVLMHLFGVVQAHRTSLNLPEPNHMSSLHRYRDSKVCFHRHFSLKILLHSSNLLTVARMEVKLGVHVYYIVSMTTTTPNSLRHFSKITSSLLKLSNGSTYIGMYAYYIISTTITCFHDDRILFEKASGNFL